MTRGLERTIYRRGKWLMFQTWKGAPHLAPRRGTSEGEMPLPQATASWRCPRTDRGEGSGKQALPSLLVEKRLTQPLRGAHTHTRQLRSSASRNSAHRWTFKHEKIMCTEICCRAAANGEARKSRNTQPGTTCTNDGPPPTKGTLRQPRRAALVGGRGGAHKSIHLECHRTLENLTKITVSKARELTQHL